jgi:tetratricopeptide (TPR) repeat protein
MNYRALVLSVFVCALSAGVANASWYDDYDQGIAAVKRGNWSVAVQKMTAAIKGNPNESDKARAYGTIFYNYHPYYYRGIANLNLGNYEQAIADLEKTQKPGEVDLGPIGANLTRAKEKLREMREPEPEATRPTPPVSQPSQPAPAVPQIDSGLRQRAGAAINAATQKVRAAQERRADGTQQYSQAMSMLTEATTKNASARSNDDLNAIISLAQTAGSLADLAMPPSAPAPSIAIPSPSTPSQIIPKPAAAASSVLEDYSDQVRLALENYFAGEFEVSTREFEALSKKMPDNAWIWAFLGASQYSQYAFEADESYKRAAEQSFKRAKELRSWKEGLPSKYFSRRIRHAFGAG